MSKSLVLALAMFAAPAAHAQAFGVEIGSDIKKYSPEPTGIDLFYRLTPPQPYVEFTSYTAPVDPEGHICTVSGLGASYEQDYLGSRAKAAFAKLRKILEGKYGAGRFQDSLKAGASSVLFQREVASGDRVYQVEWTGDDLPDGLSRVQLKIEALDSGGTYLVLNYQAPNFLECMNRRKQADTTGL